MGLILSWLFGGGISSITGLIGKIIDLQAKKVDAKTEQERNELDAQIAELQARVDLAKAEASSRFFHWVQILSALPFIIMIWVYTVGDKVICPWFWVAKSCSHDDLSTHLWYLMGLVYTFFFAGSVANFLRNR